MAITTAVQQGSWVRVLDGSRQLFTRSGTLHGYTANSVSIKEGNWIRTYNEKGQQISTQPAR